MTAAQQAREYAEAVRALRDDLGVSPETVLATATLASTYATLALVEELGRFHAVAVETREQPAPTSGTSVQRVKSWPT